jgi:hypothetical protein
MLGIPSAFNPARRRNWSTVWSKLQTVTAELECFERAEFGSTYLFNYLTIFHLPTLHY